MLPSTTSKQQEQSGTLFNAEENHNSNSSHLLVRKPIEKTPFYLVGNKEKGYFLVIGRHRITDPMPTEEEAENLLNEIPWMIQFRMAGVVHEMMAEEFAKQLETELHQKTGL